MKKLLFVGLIGLMIASCNQRSGSLTGVLGRPIYQPEIPLGMVYIPSGSYAMGENDQDVPFLHQTRSKTVSVQAFYMDQSEITNNEYRQFVYWVRDSMARERLYGTEGVGLSDDAAAAEYINYKDNYYDEANAAVVDVFDPGNRPENRAMFSLNWDKEFNYGELGMDAPESEIMPLLADMYYSQPERYYQRREIDTRKLNYKYYWIDLREAARRGRIDVNPNGYNNANPGQKEPGHRELNTPLHPLTNDPQGQDKDMGYSNKKFQNNAIRGHDNRQRFIIDETINVYPDTLCWVRDFTYSFHDPMTNMYFWHPGFDNYPVVGVTWNQAKAFSVWRTQLLNSWLQAMGDLYVNDFRLPTEAEWERAARGDLAQSAYPWGGPYIRNEAGCFLGNFKPMRGRYFEDGGFHTVKAYSYNPNGWGLYCMAGNVAEWCETAYDESMYEFSHDLNTEFRYDALDWDPPSMKRKVLRGGSWKDIGYYLQTSTRSYEYQDTAKSYIGYRNVMTHIGRGGKMFSKEGSEDNQSDIITK